MDDPDHIHMVQSQEYVRHCETAVVQNLLVDLVKGSLHPHIQGSSNWSRSRLHC